MVGKRVSASTVVGVALGAAIALLGWWVTLVSPSIIAGASITLGGAQFPVGPRLLLVGVVMVTCAVAIWWRPAALTMAAFGIAFIGYSPLVFADLASPLAPLGGWTSAGADPVRETLYAITIGGASIPLLMLGGLWLGIACWWLMRRSAPVVRRVRLALWLGLGAGMAVVAWWAQPVVARAMTVMFSQGREAFSPLPSLLILMVAAASGWLALRRPALAFGAAFTALLFAAYSLVRAAPDTGLVTTDAAQWAISFADLEQSVRSSAFRADTLELTAAWTLIAGANLLALGPVLARHPAARPSGIG